MWETRATVHILLAREEIIKGVVRKFVSGRFGDPLGRAIDHSSIMLVLAFFIFRYFVLSRKVFDVHCW